MFPILAAFGFAAPSPPTAAPNNAIYVHMCGAPDRVIKLPIAPNAERQRHECLAGCHAVCISNKRYGIRHKDNAE